MNGAESLVSTLIRCGVGVCFANPGTSEIHIVAALDQAPGIRPVLGLFEGVVTGAADGYARMAEKPACTLLHLGPGLANGLANLHNAYRARVPIINVVGQHATDHIAHDTPLTSDIEGIARPYSSWLRTSSAPAQVGRDAAEAIRAACTSPGNIATLIVPANVAWREGGIPATPLPVPAAPLPSSETIEHVSKMLRSGKRTALLLSGKALYGRGLEQAGRIAAATGAHLFCPYPFTRLQWGASLPLIERTPYILEQAKERLKEFQQLILVGAPPPVAYFAYPGKDSVLTSPDTEIYTLARPEEDLVGALSAVADEFPPKSGDLNSYAKSERPQVPTGEITLPGVSAVIGALIPDNTILVEESMTSGRGLMPATRGAPPHEWLGNTGGSIGIGMPLAVGAAIAAPERRVLCPTADGSGMYTLQALWTMARESLKITTVVFANRSYAVLKREFSYLGIGEPGPTAQEMFDLGRPNLDWVQLAKGMGVPASRVTSLDALAKALKEGFASEGPTLIEIPL
ncbi:MAG TPA: acetolactate synthase large subunit [Terriglobales bacterium]|nr:acetolactate synthase large subunit [Terriglobales bacterium]